MIDCNKTILELMRVQGSLLEAKELLAQYAPHEKMSERILVEAGLVHVRLLIDHVTDLEKLRPLIEGERKT